MRIQNKKAKNSLCLFTSYYN